MSVHIKCTFSVLPLNDTETIGPLSRLLYIYIYTRQTIYVMDVG